MLLVLVLLRVALLETWSWPRRYVRSGKPGSKPSDCLPLLLETDDEEREREGGRKREEKRSEERETEEGEKERRRLGSLLALCLLPAVVWTPAAQPTALDVRALSSPPVPSCLRSCGREWRPSSARGQQTGCRWTESHDSVDGASTEGGRGGVTVRGRRGSRGVRRGRRRAF
jgi:hypothetical protein